LRAAWTRSPQPDLAALLLANASDPSERLRRATRLVSGQLDHPESHLLMARMQLEAGDLAAARRQLEAARKGGLDQRRVWVLQADLEGRQGGDSEQARLAQRDALRRAAEAAADPTWRCEACGTALPEWRPVCPSCHTAGRVHWGVQTRAELLPPTAA
jgi:HemY protein